MSPDVEVVYSCRENRCLESWALTCFHPCDLLQPRDLWSAGRREKEGKEKPGAAAEQPDKEVEELGGFRGEDEDNGPEEDPAVAMTARMDHRAARRARRASAPAVTTSTPTTTFRPAPSQWSVEEVTAFIHTLPGKLVRIPVGTPVKCVT